MEYITLFLSWEMGHPPNNTPFFRERIHASPLTYLVLRYRLQKTNHDTLATRQLQPIRCPKCPLTIHSQPHQKKILIIFSENIFFFLFTYEHHHWCKLLLSTLFCNVLRVAQKWLDKYLLVKHYNQVVMTRTINCSWLIRKKWRAHILRKKAVKLSPHSLFHFRL